MHHINNIDILLNQAKKILKKKGKIYIFEPNSVLGRANKLIISFAEKVICYDKNIKGIK